MKNLDFFKTDIPEEKLDMIIRISWELLQRKIQHGLVKINKEASLQLQFANILQELISISRYSDSERVKVVLEDTIKLQNGKTQEIDVLLETVIKKRPYKIAIEMKCYKEFASSGGKRGAVDIFCKDVYEDIESLEKYKQDCPDIKKAYFLAMTDYENIVCPQNKKAKYWNYDISDGFNLVGPKKFNTPIGGKNVLIHIDGQYKFEWTNVESNGKQNYFLIFG